MSLPFTNSAPQELGRGRGCLQLRGAPTYAWQPVLAMGPWPGGYRVLLWEEAVVGARRHPLGETEAWSR